LSIWYTLPATSNESESDGYGRISVESIYYGQYSLMDAALDKVARQRPGIADIYFVGFAGDASQKVFLKEARSVGQLFDKRFDTAGRSMLLINNRATVYETPLANGNNLWYGLKEIGRILDPEEDVLFLFLTSHGWKDLLSVNFWPLQLDNMTAEDLRKTLDDSGIKWRVIVVSACYSGSFIDDLRTDHSLIITAAHADRTSFGCGDEFDFTYFGRAYFDQALRETFSFIEAFGSASKAIEQRESEEGLTPSQPQIDIGSAIRPKLDEIGKRLFQLHKDQVKIGAHGLSGQARE
ncbi:MAG: C13 family peptidase, partial [Alphaproteobacteria bacterium]